MFIFYWLIRVKVCTATKAAVSVLNLASPKVMGTNPLAIAISTSLSLKSPSGPMSIKVSVLGNNTFFNSFFSVG